MKDYDARVEEYFLNVSEQVGALRGLDSFWTYYDLDIVRGKVTASDVMVRLRIFNGEMQDSVTYHDLDAFISAYSTIKDKAVSFVLDKLAEFEDR